MLRPAIPAPSRQTGPASPLLYTYPDAHADHVRPYTDFLLEQFGPERLAWGSNWPVELLGGSYRESFELMQLLANELSQAERAAVFGGNAQTFYGSGGQLFQQDQGGG